jgi:hypothetical protein
MHIIILEDLLKEQKAEWQHLYKFLNIDSLRGLQNLPKPSNESMIYKNPFYSFFFNHPELQRLLPRRGKSILFFGKKEMYKYKLPNSELMVRLNKFYEPHNKAQESFIGKPINHWL